MPLRARSRILAVGLVAAALALTGCQAGSSAQTSQTYNGGDGRNVNIPADAAFKDDYLAVRNALVVSDGGAASVTVTIVNHGDTADVLTEARVGDTVAAFVGGPFEIPPRETLSVGGGSEQVALADNAGVEPGQWADLTLTFTQAGSTTIQVLVQSPDSEYTVLGENA